MGVAEEFLIHSPCVSQLKMSARKTTFERIVTLREYYTGQMATPLCSADA